MRGLRFLFVVLLVGWLLLLAGCGSGDEHRPCHTCEAGAAGSSTTSTGEGGTGGDIFDTTSSTGGEGGGPVCEGECYLWKSVLFEDLAMFWIGTGEAPPCPANAPAVGATLHADPQPTPPHTCPACSCSPAGCALPEHMHASAAKCPADGAVSIAWDSPAWGGSCTADGAITPGLMCSGVPCVQSLTIAAPSIEPCEAITEGEATDPPDPVWGLTAQECILEPKSGEGCDGSEACLQPPPEGFSLCLYRWNDDVELSPEHCPAAYPRFFVMYADHADTRTCEACLCSDPEGGDCSAVVSVFTGATCGGFLGAYTVTSAMNEACFDLPAGVGLGSKAGVLTVNEPGSCTASGGPVGDITPTLPITLCCQDPPPRPAE